MEILYQTEITRTTNEWLLYAMLISIGLMAVFGICLLAAQDDFFAWSLIASLVSSLIFGFLAMKYSCEVPTERSRYEVILNGDMSCQELYDRYEVIEHKGSIWVLEDKEDAE